MKTSWQVETSRIECRWAVQEDRAPYNPSWFQDAGVGVYASALEPTPDFAAHSLLGSGEWLVPWSLRWSVARR